MVKNTKAKTQLWQRALLVAAVLAVLGLAFLLHSRAATTGVTGDINNDGKVNIQDLALLLINFGKTAATGDLNNDGKVTIQDLALLLINFGKQDGGNPGPGDPTVTIDGIKYPNPLTLKNGNAVTTTAAWENSRRAELLADFTQNVYGQFPAPSSQKFSVQTNNGGSVLSKTITVTVTGPNGTGSFPVYLFIPKTGSKPLGTFLMIDHRGDCSSNAGQSSGYLPVTTINAAGYALACFNANDVAPDDGGSYQNNIIKLFFGSNYPNNGAKDIGAWAWAASRAMDYLVTDTDIDPSKIAVIGHSRSGKSSLWAGAQDRRFAAVIANDSGNTGDKLARRGDAGIGAETVAAINSSFPYWFPETYKAYNNREDQLPVDQHELIALVAPRRVVLGGAQDDANGDPQGGFLAYIAAAQVYKLYGLGGTGLPTTNYPPPTDTGFRGDAMSYHLRSGGHDLNTTDWDIYLKGNLFDRKPTL